jgi:hypothetical protein
MYCFCFQLLFVVLNVNINYALLYLFYSSSSFNPSYEIVQLFISEMFIFGSVQLL